MATKKQADDQAEEQERFTLTLPSTMLEKLRRIAASQQRSVAWICREGLNEWLSKEVIPPEQTALPFDKK